MHLTPFPPWVNGRPLHLLSCPRTFRRLLRRLKPLLPYYLLLMGGGGAIHRPMAVPASSALLVGGGAAVVYRPTAIPALTPLDNMAVTAGGPAAKPAPGSKRRRRPVSRGVLLAESPSRLRETRRVRNQLERERRRRKVEAVRHLRESICRATGANHWNDDVRTLSEESTIRRAAELVGTMAAELTMLRAQAAQAQQQSAAQAAVIAMGQLYYAAERPPAIAPDDDDNDATDTDSDLPALGEL